MAKVLIELSDSDLDSDDLQQAEMNLVTAISQIDGASVARRRTGQATPGTRGEPVSVGTILISLVSGGALTALVGTLQTWLTRDDRRTLKLTVESADGQKVTLDSAQFDEDQIRAFLKSAGKLIKELES